MGEGSKIYNGGKYRTFKHHFSYEKYLDTLNRNYARALTRLRISAHNLAIERGRYTRPYTPPDERICPHCPNNIQDEQHFLLVCSKYNNDRQILFDAIKDTCPMFANLSTSGMFIYMLNAEGRIINDVAKFVFKNMPWKLMSLLKHFKEYGTI